MGRQIMKIRIVHMLYSFGLGGLEGMIAGLINRMDRSIFSHSICVFCDELASLKKIDPGIAVDVHVIKRHFSHDPSVVIRLSGVLMKIRPDIVRTYNWAGMEGIVAAKLCGLRNIVHSEHGFDISEIYKQKKRRIAARRLLLKNCVKVIAVSKGLQRWLVEDVKVDSDKVAYIPNGCDISEFYPGKDAEVRRKLGIREDDIVVGTVGSLVELKDQKSLIEAFGRLAGPRNNIKLMLVGDGPMRNELERLSRAAGVKEKTIFTGRVTGPASFYRAMDIFALPSLSENMPNVLLQAMATGLPVIATDVGDVGHILDGEERGIIVKPKDIDAMEQGIKLFLDHPELGKDMGSAARKRIEEAFDILRIKNAYEKLYESIME